MPQPIVSVVYLLYHAQEMVPALFKALDGQVHPEHEVAGDWLDVQFVDDCSSDETWEAVQAELKKRNSPPWIRAIRNDLNLGLSKTLNASIQRARAPYVLTNHCDVLFGSSDYIFKMVQAMEQNPNAAAITSRPQIPEKALDFSEKVNLIANLMDILEEQADAPLIAVGFAEGRCDLFRISALEKVGLYDTHLRTAGEDQVLAGRLRSAGYEILQATQLRYSLSVSNEQNTLRKLLRHQELFGRAHPYILLKNPRTSEGAYGGSAGKNRSRRTLLRLSQLLFASYYLIGGLPVLHFLGAATFISSFLGISFIKYLLFKDHLRAVPLQGKEFVSFFLFQPFLDISYTRGFLEGLFLATVPQKSRTI